MQQKIETFDLAIHSFVGIYVSELEKKGFSEDDVVAMDMDEYYIFFHMSDGSIVEIPQGTILSGGGGNA